VSVAGTSGRIALGHRVLESGGDSSDRYFLFHFVAIHSFGFEFSFELVPKFVLFATIRSLHSDLAQIHDS